jgi:hypothetical protein
VKKPASGSPQVSRSLPGPKEIFGPKAEVLEAIAVGWPQIAGHDLTLAFFHLRRRPVAVAGSSSPSLGKYSGEQVKSASCPWLPSSTFRNRARFSRLAKRSAGRAWMRTMAARPFPWACGCRNAPRYQEPPGTNHLAASLYCSPGKLILR